MVWWLLFPVCVSVVVFGLGLNSVLLKDHQLLWHLSSIAMVHSPQTCIRYKFWHLIFRYIYILLLFLTSIYSTGTNVFVNYFLLNLDNRNICFSFLRWDSYNSSHYFSNVLIHNGSYKHNLKVAEHKVTFYWRLYTICFRYKTHIKFTNLMYHEQACLTLYFKGNLALLIPCIYILKHESKVKSKIRYILLFI